MHDWCTNGNWCTCRCPIKGIQLILKLLKLDICNWIPPLWRANTFCKKQACTEPMKIKNFVIDNVINRIGLPSFFLGQTSGYTDGYIAEQDTLFSTYMKRWWQKSRAGSNSFHADIFVFTCQKGIRTMTNKVSMGQQMSWGKKKLKKHNVYFTCDLLHIIWGLLHSDLGTRFAFRVQATKDKSMPIVLQCITFKIKCAQSPQS